MPPRSTARGARAAPKNAEISGLEPSVREKPMRGLIVIGDGRRSLRSPKISLDGRVEAGTAVKCSRQLAGRTGSAGPGCADTNRRARCAPVNWPVERRRAVSVRVNDAGMPASRSASELKEKVPSRFDRLVLRCCSRCSSVVELDAMPVGVVEPRQRVREVVVDGARARAQSLVAAERERLHAARAVGEHRVHAHSSGRQIEVRIAVVARRR